MTHLTEEQFEDILQGHTGVPAHIDECPQCRARLNEKRALAHRVHRAFFPVRANSALADRVRAQITAAGQTPVAAKARPRIVPLRARRPIWFALAAAAVVLIAVVPRGLHVDTGSKVKAAQTALVGIHRTNLDSLEQLVNDDDPGKLCEYLENQEGHCLATPCSKSTLCMCGCCVQEFQGRLVASYVARGSTAPISVVVLRYPPKGLGMTPNTTLTAAGHAVWQVSCGPCNMACVCIADTSHCAIGHVPQEELVAVLNSLVK